jgi:hypothetical protein
MSKFLVFEAVPGADRGWELRDAAGVCLLRASSKKELLRSAELLVRERAPSQLLVRGNEGELLDEFTYGPAAIPPPF